MTDQAQLPDYYAKMSDEELAESFAEGSASFLPETWKIINAQMSSRQIEVDAPVLRDAVAMRESARPAALSPESRMKNAAKTAYAFAAIFLVIALIGIYYHPLSIQTLLALGTAAAYLIAGVRMKLRASERAAIAALVATALFAVLDLYWSFSSGSFAMVFFVLGFGLPMYRFMDAVKAAGELRDATKRITVTATG